MTVIKAVFMIIANLIVYVCFGALIVKRRGRKLSIPFCMITGFFLYYCVFFAFCFPVMVRYRPLSMLTRIWIPAVIVIAVISVSINHRALYEAVRDLAGEIKAHPLFTAFIALLFIAQILLVTISYNFTLDAAFYVADVTTNVETDMINVYDPFTGLWQDHFEFRYMLATYPINDAVMCQLIKMPALVWTKTVMSATVIILVNSLYCMICRFFYRDDYRASALMMGAIGLVNLTFSTLYSPSLFLLTRTYEGKTIVGNLTLIMIFYIFMRMMSREDDELMRPWLILFIISLGSMTISSSANMLVPGILSILFIPYMIINKTKKPFFKYIACMLPGFVYAASYIMYVKGVFVLYTYPRIYR